MSISKSQLDNFAKIGKSDYTIDDAYVPDLNNTTLAFFEQYAKTFFEEIQKELKDKKVKRASGDLADNTKVVANEDGSGIKISMINYYDFVNKGVKGVRSSTNAPSSPYKYKTYGMPLSARIGIKKYIESGKASIREETSKKTIIAAQKKTVSIDLQVQTMVYLIKKWGIKTTNFFDNATERVTKDLSEDLMYLIGKTIIVKIGQPKKKSK
jgi:hypothetical protein